MGPTLIGRDALVGDLQSALDASHRLLSVVGPAGVGKTALLQATLVDPVLWDLGHVRNADEALYTLATSLGVDATGPHRVQLLGDALKRLGERRLWIDHADRWHTQALEWLEGWWIQHPTLEVVWTSRLHLPPRFGTPLSVDPLEDDHALELFALRASPTGVLPDSWDEDASELTRRLGGLPLAIEMAASWTTLLSPSELLRRADLIEQWLMFGPTTPERAERLRGAIAWSWSMLSPSEQQLAWSCATRPAGAVFEDLEEIGRALGHAPHEVTSILHSLQRHSLLFSKTCPWTSRQRLSLYEPVRAFLAAQDTHETQAIAQLNTQTLVARAEQHYLDFEGPDPNRSMRWLQAERPNLLAIMDRERNPRPEWATRTAIALLPLLTLSGAWRSQQRILRDALLCAEASGDDILIARAACALGSGLTSHGHFAEADRVFHGTYETLTAPDALQHMRHSLIIHAHAVAWLDEDDRAERMLDHAERLLEGAPTNAYFLDKDRLHLELQRAFLRQRVGTPSALKEAYVHIERATTCADATNQRRPGYLCRYIRGQILLQIGRPHEAYASLQAAIEGLVGIGEHNSKATGLQWMARAARAYGDPQHAEELLREGVTLARQRFDLESEVELQAEWVEHHMSQQRLEQARQALRRTRRLAAQSQIPASRHLPEQLQHRLDRLEELIEDTSLPPRLHICRDASGWTGDGEETSLHTRPTLRRVLARLCEAREQQPGQMLDREELFAAGWPGESIQMHSRNQRVYTAVWTLRRLGLGGALLSNDQGYALCPAQTALVTP